jgi:arylsulfatase A-like enzyme
MGRQPACCYRNHEKEYRHSRHRHRIGRFDAKEEKFKGQLHQGWDRYREEFYQRQLKLGVIPPDTKLTPRPKGDTRSEPLSSDEERVAERLMETFAAYTAQTD